MPKRGTTRERSGLFQVKLTRRSLDFRSQDFVREVRCWLEENTPKQAADLFLEVLHSAEEQAFAIYRRHGLPAEVGTFAQLGDGTWIPVSDPQRTLKLKHRFHYQLGAEADPDSDLAIAANVLEQTDRCRRQIKAWCAEQAFIEAWSLASDLTLLFVEFGLGEVVGPAMAQVSGRKAGGTKRAGEVKAKVALKHAHWREIDEQLKPGSRNQRAEIVSRRVRGTKHAGSVSSIRKVLPERK